jgi:hypothetical protein
MDDDEIGANTANTGWYARQNGVRMSRNQKNPRCKIYRALLVSIRIYENPGFTPVCISAGLKH